MYPLIQYYFYTLYCKLRTFWRTSPITPLQIRTDCLLPYQPFYTLKIKIPRDCTLQSSCFRGTLPNLPLPSECSRPGQLHKWTLTIWVCGLQWWTWQIIISIIIQTINTHTMQTATIHTHCMIVCSSLLYNPIGNYVPSYHGYLHTLLPIL